MVDRRPLVPENLTNNNEWPLLAASANLAYAAESGYAFLFTSYTDESLEGRHYGWSKIAVLREVMEAHQEVEYFAFLDGDATFRKGVQLLDSLVPDLFNNKSKLFFFARDPTGLGPKGKLGEWNGHRNIQNNTRHTCGFFVIQNTPRARALVAEWWRIPDVVPSMEQYKYLWPHCQRCWDDIMRPKHPDVWTEADNVSDFNTPNGRFVRHVWWKGNAAFTVPWKSELSKITRSSGAVWQTLRFGETGYFPIWWESRQNASLVLAPLKPVPRGPVESLTIHGATDYEQSTNPHLLPGSKPASKVPGVANNLKKQDVTCTPKETCTKHLKKGKGSLKWAKGNSKKRASKNE